MTEPTKPTPPEQKICNSPRHNMGNCEVAGLPREHWCANCYVFRPGEPAARSLASRPYEVGLLKRLADSNYAIHYLTAAEDFKAALQDVAEAHGIALTPTQAPQEATRLEPVVAEWCQQGTCPTCLRPVINFNPASLGDFVNRTLAMWEEAADDPEMKDVRFDVASEILRNTYSVKEMTAALSEGAQRKPKS